MHGIGLKTSGSGDSTLANGYENRSWRGPGRPSEKLPHPFFSLLAGAAIALIGFFVLVGWQLNNTYLMRWVPTLRPMNPMSAVGLVVLGYALFCYWHGSMRQLRWAGVFGIALGVAAILPLHIDHLLYGARVTAAGAHNNVGVSAGTCFIAIGLTPFTIGVRRWFGVWIQSGLFAVVAGLSLYNIFGQMYAYDAVYKGNGNFVMSIDLSVAFLIFAATFLLLMLYRRVGNVLGGVTHLGWLILIVLVLAQAFIYVAWAQIIGRNRADASRAFTTSANELDDAVAQRLQVYSHALYGFRGLFAASDYVDQGEFQAYYNSLNVAQTYPGIRAVSFIARVGDADLPTFVAEQRADSSLHSGGNPSFAVNAKTSLPIHYIVTYNASTDSTGGTDLGSYPDRLSAFQKADVTDAPVASGTVTFAASGRQSSQQGFFITIPVSDRSGAEVGYVNALFNYKDFFAQVSAEQGALQGANVVVADIQEKAPLFSHKEVRLDSSAFSYAEEIPVADRSWRLVVGAPAVYGISINQVELPRAILATGQLFSVLLILIFIIQYRARRQALDLAQRITLDLQLERNTAVATNQRNTAILDSIGDAVFAVNADRRITLFNRAAVRLSGYTEAEALGRPYQEILRFILEKTNKPNTSFITKAFNGRVTSMRNHTSLLRKDGRRVAVADSAAPIRDAGGAILGVIVVFRDVSKEQALEQAKTDFVSLASHQLRTPLSAINWYGEMLLGEDAGKLNKEQRAYLQEIYDGNQRMIELVDALLNVSRLEVGKLHNEPIETSMPEVVESVQKEMAATIAGKELQVNTRFARAVPSVFADPKLLRMVAQNLLSNAVKYTPAKGAIAVVVREATKAEVAARKLRPGRYLFFSVADTGYGIPKMQQDKIFEKLFRADNVRKLDVEGTGLGLYIVREVAQRLGGAVWFESMESIGTTVYVIIPLKTHSTALSKTNERTPRGYI